MASREQHDGTNCFACGRPIRRKEPFVAQPKDDQIVFVGPECNKLILAAGMTGYQPMSKGLPYGPRLYPMPEGFVYDYSPSAVDLNFLELKRLRKLQGMFQDED